MEETVDAVGSTFQTAGRTWISECHAIHGSASERTRSACRNRYELIFRSRHTVTPRRRLCQNPSRVITVRRTLWENTNKKYRRPHYMHGAAQRVENRWTPLSATRALRGMVFWRFVPSMRSCSQLCLILHPHRVAVPFPPTFATPWWNSFVQIHAEQLCWRPNLGTPIKHNRKRPKIVVVQSYCSNNPPPGNRRFIMKSRAWPPAH